jgi:hypothetical protein
VALVARGPAHIATQTKLVRAAHPDGCISMRRATQRPRFITNDRSSAMCQIDMRNKHGRVRKFGGGPSSEP